MLAEIVESQCFKSLYFEKVHSTGHESYSNSFHQFFDELFTPLVNFENLADKQSIIRKLEELFKKPPFNAGFGMYLYLERDSIKHLFQQAE